MRVTPYVGRKGAVVCSVDGALALFDRRGVQPEAGTEIEIMVTSHLPRRFPEGYFDRPEEERDGGFIPALIVQPVTADHVLVEHEGFECSGSMCRTTAGVTEAGDRAVSLHYQPGISFLTPGRTPVVSVSNVSVGWAFRDGNGVLHKQEYREPTPGTAYVSLTDLRAGYQRIAGVPDLAQLDPMVLRLLTRRRPRAAPSEEAPRDPERRRRGVRNAQDKARACGEPTVAEVRAGLR